MEAEIEEIVVSLTPTSGLVFDFNSVASLRQNHKISSNTPLPATLSIQQISHLTNSLTNSTKTLKLISSPSHSPITSSIIEAYWENKALQRTTHIPTSSKDQPYYNPSPTSLIYTSPLQHVYSLLQALNRYYITAEACKYGGDLLLYKHDPFVCHSSFIVIVKENSESRIDFLDLISAARLGTNVAKRIVYATADVEGDGHAKELSSFGVDWAGF